MRATLRRSCDACAKAKHSCDLLTPRCSRCIKRKSTCVYANQPLTSSRHANASSRNARRLTAGANGERSSNMDMARDESVSPGFPDSSVVQLNSIDASFDPFDSHPPTRLPRAHVQRLMHHFLSNIAFQYYPLDLNTESNPFIVSWWPSALGDPALFHVSLQTASLDEELRAQKGFPISEMLMMDSVSLVRRNIEDSSSAIRDETMNSVVTLAAIEVNTILHAHVRHRLSTANSSYTQHGKGNLQATRMHINGVIRMVNMRGGIGEVKRTSPLTARMVSWVSMLVMGAPQFQVADDSRRGDGISPTPQWQLACADSDVQQGAHNDFDADPAITEILVYLRYIFQRTRLSHLTSTELHDLTCFVVHKLLLLPPLSPADRSRSAVSECLRYSSALYMLIIHGTTYYSHLGLAHNILLQLQSHLEALAQTEYFNGAVGIWVLSVCMETTMGMANCEWFIKQAFSVAIALGLQTWDDVVKQLNGILWLRTRHSVTLRQKWEEILATTKLQVL
ncbi:hypothetical protein BGZ63DRAFT_52493 [Mariannaea sp. PMI_226]|nr:hypothetical protein BGZ63DRAFT_52493 [Mariannaea sp. PMI_226]